MGNFWWCGAVVWESCVAQRRRRKAVFPRRQVDDIWRTIGGCISKKTSSNHPPKLIQKPEQKLQCLDCKHNHPNYLHSSSKHTPNHPTILQKQGKCFLGRDVIRFMYPDPTVPEPVRQTADSSPADLLLAHIPNRVSRPLSRRKDPEGSQSMFGSSDVASDLLDIEFLCRKAFETFGDTFPTSVWTCCQKVCFAALATGTCGSPRFF